ncbi:MAG: deoxyribonuclease IV [Candidatus Izemoplasmatales bacterium]|nr:deoxyribonuclease IV [Candidatus Izemoplasmatales bacterium]
MLRIGSHVSLGGVEQFLGSVKEAYSYGANALMVYTGAPQNTIRQPIEKMRIEEAHQFMIEHNMEKENIIVHAPYIVNLGNPDPVKQEFAIAFLSEEIRRTEALGSHVIVLHPGAHMNEGSEAGIARIAEGVNAILTKTAPSSVVIALEGMAGKGTEVGRTFEELAGIIQLIEDQSRIGVCLDTCHMSDAGYPVKDDFDAILDEFDRVVGLSYLKVLHVNDSKNPQGAHKDRHENIGFGFLGFDAIFKAIHHPKLEAIPKILETPYVDSLTDSKKSYPPYRYEIEMIRKGEMNSNLLDDVRRENEA